MITCNTCGARISDLVTRCPRCGADPRGPRDKFRSTALEYAARAKEEAQENRGAARCAHCGQTIPLSGARFCPWCGASTNPAAASAAAAKPRKSIFRRWWFWAAVVVLALAVVGASFQERVRENRSTATEPSAPEAESVPSAELADEYAEADYSAIERQPDRFKGEKITFSGTVIQVMEGVFDSLTLRVEENSGNIWYVTYTRKSGEDRILEDDYITCYGVCDGVRSYSALLGNQVTIPSLKMDKYTLNERVDANVKPEYEITDIVFDIDNSGYGTRYYAYVEITNTGKNNIYLEDCTFNLEDNGGHLLQSDRYASSCPSVISPGEKGYFYEVMGNSIDDGVSLSNGVNLVPDLTVKVSKRTPDVFEAADVSLRDSGGGRPTVTGRITNTSRSDESFLYVHVIYYGADGRVIGISGTSLTDFAAGRTMSFEISGIGLGSGVTVDKIADYKVVAQAGYYQY